MSLIIRQVKMKWEKKELDKDWWIALFCHWT